MFFVTDVKTGAKEGPMGMDEAAVFIENHSHRLNEDKLDSLLSLLAEVEDGVPFEDNEEHINEIAVSMGFEVEAE